MTAPMGEKVKSLLVRLIGFPASLVHGDPLVLDRWLWLRQRLPRAEDSSRRLLDVGCGTGAYTIGTSRLGYHALGLSWDARNQQIAQYRAALCGADLAKFEILDVRHLDDRADLRNSFDVVVCSEVVEHILDDEKLFRDMAACLKPGGKLFLTTPNVGYRAITKEDNGPFSTIEDGWHVRKGYSESDIRRLCNATGLRCLEITYCSGFFSQKITWLMRSATRIHHLLGWAVVLPLRVFPPLLDPMVQRVFDYPGYSITLVATKN